MSRTGWITLLILGLIIAVMAAIAWRVSQQAPTNAPLSAIETALVGTSTTDAFVDLAGNAVDVADRIDGMVIAHTWASWVPSSKETLRDLARLQSEYADQGVQVLAINRAEPLATAEAFLRTYDIEGLELVVDTDDRYFAQIGGMTMPETVFYTADGAVFRHERTRLTLVELRTITDQLVAANQE